MLVVISDLHFQEEESALIPIPGGTIGHRRNLPHRAFQQFVRRIAEEARRNGGGRADGSAGTRKLDLVLAGDIFEVTRTMLWCEYEGGPMPYDDPPAPGSELEKRVLRVLDAIARDARVEPTLATFRLLAQDPPQYVDGGGAPLAFPADEVEIHYVTGNHDRACDATPAIRAWVRGKLGMAGGDAPFPHQLLFPDPPVLVRHGHEYDPRAFGTDYTKFKVLPEPIPDAAYAPSGLGDFVTIEIASRLPWELIKKYGKDRIKETPLLAHVYERLLEFDDVRPQSELLNFLLTDPDTDREQVWALVEPLLRTILDRLSRDPWFRRWANQRGGWQRDVLRIILDFRIWRLTRRIPRNFMERLMDGGGTEPPAPVLFAAKEPALQQGRARYVIAGHTHNPTVDLAIPDEHGGRYYVDTGTWRNRVPAAPDRSGFGRLKALTYVIVYATTEDLGGAGEPTLSSFDYWAGFTQRFPVD